MTTNRGAATKARILEAAVQLYASGGFQHLRIATLCDIVGISPTSVYWHFGNKAGLVQAVLEKAFAPVGEAMLQDLELGGGVARQVEQFIDRLRTLVRERPVGACSMLAYLRDSGLQSTDIEAALNGLRRDELRRQVAIFTEAAGLEQADARHVAVTINACLNYAVMIKLVGGEDDEIETVLDTIRATLLGALE